MTPTVPFWDTVVVNLAPIIVALTGLFACLGGFYMQYRMMKNQNRKLDENAADADKARTEIKNKLDSVIKNGNGDSHP